MIYFVEQGRSGQIKIGFTTDMKKRLSQLQVGSPQKLNVLGIVEDGDERTVQQLFHEHHIMGEWYRDCPEIRNYIEKHTVPYLPRPNFKTNRKGKTAKVIITAIGTKWHYSCPEWGVDRTGEVTNSRIVDRIVLTGAIDAVRQLGVFVDTIEFTVPGEWMSKVLRERIFAFWERVGWVYRDGRSVGNKDLWQEFIRELTKFRLNVRARADFGYKGRGGAG